VGVPASDQVRQRLKLTDQQAQEYTAMVNESRRTMDVNAREAAWWTFVGVALSLLSAMAGGWCGTGAQIMLRRADDRPIAAVEPRPA
jgi:hypothetical protein